MSDALPTVKAAETRRAWAGPGFTEFVTIVALMMAVTAISIDNLLPAFPAIESRFAVSDPNHLQLLVYVYMLGFGPAQIIYGPLSDSLGRRPVLMASLGVYVAGCLLAMVAPSFGWLLAARVIQGIGAAGGRVLSTAIVRDRFAGRDMASVMSLIMMVFLIVPMIAPAIGGAMLAFGSWIYVFISMLVLAFILTAWFGWRMPETLHPEYRRPLSLKATIQAVRLTVSTRVAVGYATALGLLTGCIMGYVGSAEQVFDTGLYRLGPLFPLAFGMVAGAMGAATLINSRVVRRLGMRRLSHAGTLAFTLVGLVQVAVGLAYGGHPPLALFLAVLAANQFLISFAMPNFNALALEPLGAVAGTASSFLGFYTTILGAACGYAIGQSFDGTVLPIGLGYAGLGALALVVVAWTERWRLFGQGSST
ncbi:DHA1 family bicyclomycin/chloramphenicol resistance-like MFS transporter [Methylobacterium persicinum]|uniref:DHA1 family bicyclomycin/chloramphenicol resistance-like MFS transporter n=2 Tax=Methylobacterium persicinum TaxID=374426 RepID=A0ABU0HI45_9HYPH|nr:DHA1 family bicyclomycin/chloramphenicol resistance-like MFS transporter [Methylobacterium persicinum]GJE38906.1 Bicyclomycin resistance protein [Methylobacterium persicinum]